MTTGGALILVGTPIGNLADLSPRAVVALRDADEVWCEDTRRTRALLTHAGITGKRLRSVPGHDEAAAAAAVIERVAAGGVVAYASDAGMPGVSDPGSRLVAACVAAGLNVSVVPGPSAAIAALVVSGLPTDRFTFEGFLARKGPERRAALARIAASTVTSIVYEAPTRVVATIADLAGTCGPGRAAAIVRELTKLHEDVRRGELAAIDTSGIRGECVIVVGPAPPAPAIDDATIDAAILDEFTSGASARDAAAAVAGALGVAKRRAYERALALRATG